MAPLKIFKTSEDQRKNIYKSLDVTETEVNENIKTIQNWVKSQPHFPEIPDGSIIRALLIMNKFRINKVKDKISLYYVIRTIMPDIFNVYINSPNMISAKKAFDYVPIPELAPDLSRLIVFRISDTASDQFDPLLYMAYCMLITEIRLREDFRVREVYVYDMKNVKLSHFLKTSPVVIKKVTTIMEKLYSDNSVFINLINVAPFAMNFIGLLKKLHPAKTQDRFLVHQNLDSLYNVVSKEALPNEYGGNAGTIEEITEKWSQKLSEYEPLYEYLRGIKIDQDLLPQNLKIDDNFGVHGNFKKLDVD